MMMAAHEDQAPHVQPLGIELHGVNPLNEHQIGREEHNSLLSLVKKIGRDGANSSPSFRGNKGAIAAREFVEGMDI